MAQMGWIYCANSGKNFKVGLYHGQQSGHLMIHVNRRITQIDFKIKSDKTYSFMLDDDLCELKIEVRDGEFFYSLTENKRSDTIPNIQRRKQDLRYMWISLAILIMFALLILGLLYYA